MERPLASAAPKVLAGDFDNFHYQKIYLSGVCAFRGIGLDFRHPHDLQPRTTCHGLRQIAPASQRSSPHCRTAWLKRPFLRPIRPVGKRGLFGELGVLGRGGQAGVGSVLVLFSHHSGTQPFYHTDYHLAGYLAGHDFRHLPGYLGRPFNPDFRYYRLVLADISFWLDNFDGFLRVPGSVSTRLH